MQTHRTLPTRAAPGVLLLTTAEAAERLFVSPHTLVDWRRPGARGPDLPWVRVGKRLYYREDDLVAFMSRLLLERHHAVRTRLRARRTLNQASQAA